MDTRECELPKVGDGVTLVERGELKPGTILRVSTSGRCVWFRLDEPVAGSARLFRPAANHWVHRAIRQADGVFREDHDMSRVEVGVRRSGADRTIARPGPTPRCLADLVEAVDRIEPWLLKTRWYPMTYMMIPSVLHSADALAAELAAAETERQSERERLGALRAHVGKLRAGFKRRV